MKPDKYIKKSQKKVDKAVGVFTKAIDEVIRALSPRSRYVSTSKSTQNSIKNY